MKGQQRDTYGDFQVEEAFGNWVIADLEDGGFVSKTFPYATSGLEHARGFESFEEASRVAEILWRGRRGRPGWLRRWFKRLAARLGGKS